jgi:hypothetical protein
MADRRQLELSRSPLFARRCSHRCQALPLTTARARSTLRWRQVAGGGEGHPARASGSAEFKGALHGKAGTGGLVYAGEPSRLRAARDAAEDAHRQWRGRATLLESRIAVYHPPA